MIREKMTRRNFVSSLMKTGVVLPIIGKGGTESWKSQGKPNRPLIVTSKTNPAVKEQITTTAWEVLQKGGTPIDASEKATNVSEIDPRDPTVGYGGDPNEEGFLQLDASVMNGSDFNNAGSVAALENIKTPCSVARLVMERTDHLMLVGKGALKFAKMHGFKEGGTINVLVLDEKGDIAGVTSTVGHHFKIVGRVGDSPIIGAGLYVDNDVGAAGATGHGAEAIKVCASFLTVEKMREGFSPQSACRYVCQRVIDRHGGKPLFGLKIVALTKNGDYGCCSIRGKIDKETGKVIGLGFSVHDAKGHRTEAGEAILPPMTEEERKSIPWR
jgi:N4-(beta-N-acetylglucosaminyl)-L-asparaginase